MRRVVVAMSGGVDSSVAAVILKEQGYEVIGVTMCLGIAEEADEKARCCGASAIEDARGVCAQLDIPHYVLNFSEELEGLVINDFVSEYQKGRTPNPCVQCNRYLKFGKLFEYARSLGAEALATGHYACLAQRNGNYYLQRPKDTRKDQTYFLYCIKKEQLPLILFPLAQYTKEEVRERAHSSGLKVAAKPQSQDICFVPDGGYRAFLQRRFPHCAVGDIVDRAGNVLGRHQGIINYTVGQRGGLGIAAAHPLYVLALDGEHNRVIVGVREELRCDQFRVCDLNVLVEDFPHELTVKIRYGHEAQPCSVSWVDSHLQVTFLTPQEAITPGQAAVFYDDQTVVAGGCIMG